MSESTKIQPYKYSMRVVTFVNWVNEFGGNSGDICSDGIILYPVPPEDAISIESLSMHLIMQFDSGVAADKRVLKKIGIFDEYTNPTAFGWPNRMRIYDVNIAADVNRKIDKRIDLTALLKKDDVGYRELVMPLEAPDTGYTYIYLGFDTSLFGSSLIGKVLLWKVESLYTTRGIV